MSKQSGAFLTIGELSTELDVPQHILRYWETRFPMLRPLQRAGNRRYYRPDDVELARRIHRLLNVEGYTVRGAQQALSGKGGVVNKAVDTSAAPVLQTVPVQPSDASSSVTQQDRAAIIARLTAIRATLESALAK